MERFRIPEPSTRRKDGPDPQARWHVAPGLARPHIAPSSPKAARSLAHQREAGRAGSPGRSAGEARAKRRTDRNGEAAGPSATERPSPLGVVAAASRFYTAAGENAAWKTGVQCFVTVARECRSLAVGIHSILGC